MKYAIMSDAQELLVKGDTKTGMKSLASYGIELAQSLYPQEFEDGTTVDRKIVIVVTADEKAVLVDMTMTDKLASNNGVLDIEGMKKRVEEW